MGNFAGLHVHTEGSLLDGLSRTDDLFRVTKEQGGTAVAITNHGSLIDVWRAKESSRKHGIKFIPGVEFYVALREDATLGDRSHPKTSTVVQIGDDSDDRVKGYYHLTVLASSAHGWKNLIAISYRAQQTKSGKYPLVDMALLAEFSEGLIALTGCVGGPVLGPLASDKDELARQNLSEIVKAFGKGNVYLEVMEHGLHDETRALPKMHALSVETGIPLVATNDSHYTHEEDTNAHDAWLAVRTKSTLSDPGRYRFDGAGYHLRSDSEMRAIWLPATPGDPRILHDARYRSALERGLQNPLLRPMLAPGAVDDALVEDLTNGQGDTPEHGELAARIAREQNRFELLGRVSGNPHHPRNWWDDAVSQSGLIADAVADDIIPDGQPQLPKFPLPDGYDSAEDYLYSLTVAGAKRIYGDALSPAVRARLREEWDVIVPLGFADYYLIIWHLIDWARSTRPIAPGGPEKKPIYVGPGRGSGAGSLVAYCLSITMLDPLEHNLLFERFLEPGRSDFPDFDTDFEVSRFEEILDFLEGFWGRGHVARIGNLGFARSRRAIRDAARVLELERVGDRLARLVPVNEGVPATFAALLDDTNAETAEFRREIERSGEEATQVLDLARQFIDVINNAGIHACGVVVSDQYLPDLIPVRLHSSGRLVTEWDSKNIESFGLLKVDVLSLRNLDVIHTAIDYIEQTTGEAMTMYGIPDPKTKGNPRVERAWQLLRDGRTSGIFQMDSDGMTALAQDVQSSELGHLSAILALYRPGPMEIGMPEHYALRKNGREAVDYSIYTSDPAEQRAIASVLDDTFGVQVYQEQVMRLGGVLAGFDAKLRSMLRRAIGKKKKDLMDVVRPAFFEGALRETYDEAGDLLSPALSQKTAELIWHSFEVNAKYQFNASHSFAYGLIAYYTAYLKANWPAEYGAAILANTKDKDKRAEAMRALTGEGIEVLPPDVNLSGVVTRPDGERAVRIGLGELSGSSKEIAQSIIRARDEAGAFTSLEDFVLRVRIDDIGNKQLPFDKLIGLIEAGALDQFGPRYGLSMVSRVATMSLPAGVPSMEWGTIERAARQRQRLGVSLGEHPLTVFQQDIRAWRKEVRDTDGSLLYSEPGVPVGAVPDQNGASVTVLGLLAGWSEGSYRGGRKAAIRVEGSLGSLDGVMWDRELQDQRIIGVPPIGWPIAVTAKVRIREFDQEDDEGNITTVLVKQLTVSRVDPIEIDDPPTGRLTHAEVDVPDFTVVEPTPDEPQEDEPVPGTIFVEPGIRASILLGQIPERLKEDGAKLSPRFSQKRDEYTLLGSNGQPRARIVVKR